MAAIAWNISIRISLNSDIMLMEMKAVLATTRIVSHGLFDSHVYPSNSITYNMHVVRKLIIAYNLRVVNTWRKLFMTFGKRLRDVRMKRNLTQRAISEHLGIALRTYQCYEQGTREPGLDMLTSLADYLDVSADYLLGRKERIDEEDA